MDLFERLRTNQTRYDLTVCILSLANRLGSLERILKELRYQSQKYKVQVLYLGDNKAMKVGEKRNAVLSLAEGVYITFIDDDDTIAPNYIEKIMGAMESKPDVITFQVRKFFENVYSRTHVYRKDSGPIHRNPRNRLQEFHEPDHLCVWKRSIIREAFPPKSLHEDHNWADKMNKHINTIVDIPEELYYYNFSRIDSETQGR